MVKPWGEDITEGYRVMMALDATYRSVYKLRDRTCKREGLHGTQMEVMAHIRYLGEAASPTVIAGIMNRDPHAISQLISRMCDAGLVQKTVRPENKRSVKLSLTKFGEESYVAAKNKNVLVRIVLQMSKEKRNQLIMLLSDLWMIVQRELESELPKDHPMLKLLSEKQDQEAGVDRP